MCISAVAVAVVGLTFVLSCFTDPCPRGGCPCQTRNASREFSGKKLSRRLRLPIPETFCGPLLSAVHTGSQRQIGVTDSRGELIAFCPVRGKNPGGACPPTAAHIRAARTTVAAQLKVWGNDWLQTESTLLTKKRIIMIKHFG